MEAEDAAPSPDTRKKASQCSEFLASFKYAVGLGNLTPLKPAEYLQNLAEIGLCPNDAKMIVQGLTPHNYCDGPLGDHYDDETDVWIFGHRLNNSVEVYIKLRLKPTKKKNVMQAQIWSFHRAQQPLRYPLRNSR